MFGIKRFGRRCRPPPVVEALEDRTVPSVLADAGGPYTIFEGDLLTLDASRSLGPAGATLAYDWDLGADGVWSDAVGVAPTIPWSRLPQDGPATLDIRVMVTDGVDVDVSPTTTLTVLNAPPQVTILPTYLPWPVRVPGPGGIPTVVLIQAVNLMASPSDPSPIDQSAGFTYDWNATVIGFPTFSHFAGPSLFLTVPGTYAVTVGVTDKDGGVGTASGTFTVQSPVLPWATTPSQVYAIGADAGADSHVVVIDNRSGEPVRSFIAYPGFLGGVRVAVGDVTGDRVADVITGPGPGGPPHVKVFDGQTGAEVASFMAFAPQFNGGLFVASGDVNRDGRSDVIVGADAGAGPHVMVFSGRDFSPLYSFMAYADVFRGGVRVAAGDVNGDGRADIVTGAGPGAGSHVKVFSGSDLTELASFMAYGGFAGGVFVAAGDLDGDGRAEVLTGAGPGAASHVKVFSGPDLNERISFVAWDGFGGGVRVAVADWGMDGRADLVLGAGPGAGPHVKVLSGLTLAELDSFWAYDPAFTGGLFVG